MDVKGFFDTDTNTISYVVTDKKTAICAVIDSVLDLDYASGNIKYENVDKIVDFITENHLKLEWLVETHVHADHLSAAPYIQQKLGGRIAISKEIVHVQKIFGKIFNAGTEFERDGSQFDLLLNDGDSYSVGNLQAKAIHTPGHTPACMAHMIEDCVFVGDTLFMPDGGTARADFPGGDARVLYRSIQKILALPDETRLFVCHDYMPEGRKVEWETTVAEQKNNNIHIGGAISEDEFVKLRETRDVTLGMPKLIMPSIQVNMRAGHMPPSEDDGKTYLKVPISGIKG
ncbi:MAG: MBL fold metallo-hydrolase [Alphaproteobacteria bacterium]|nr:MBL fold metallo-hydrolase [Alphaproteobacteria bacterium]MBT5799803.1 MBL fold metallo-hydrolase [Alphaproteobacteria bacterium]